MDWIKIKNIRWEKVQNILFVIAILSLLGIGIEILLTEKVGIGQVGATLIIGILTVFVSAMNISATIKQSSKNTFINTITIARKEYMAELRKAVEEFCVTAERNDNEKLKELSYKLKLLMNPADKDNKHWDRKAIEMIDKIVQVENKTEDIDRFITLMQSWLAIEWYGMREEAKKGVMSKEDKKLYAYPLCLLPHRSKRRPKERRNRLRPKLLCRTNTKSRINRRTTKPAVSLKTRDKLRMAENQLSQNIYQRGVDGKGFGRIRSKGDTALFGGHTTEDNYNVENKDLQGEQPITKEHIQNNQSVRAMLGQRGIKPEELPPAEDIKKLERNVTRDERKIEQTSQKLPKNKKLSR